MLASKTRSYIAFALSTVSALAISTAYAQQSASGEKSVGLEEIVVTAQKRSENLQVTPVAVTAITPAKILEAGIHDTRDLAQHTPSLNITPSGGGSTVSQLVALRGMYQNAINITNDPSVALYIDDIYIGKDSGSVTDLVDMAQIEVLKGPQGTLYGRNSTGGAIRYISARPDPSKFGGYVRAGYGNYNTALIEGALNAPLSTNAAARVAVSYRRHDGYNHAYYGDFGASGLTIARDAHVNDLDSLLVRGSFLVNASDDLTFYVTGSYHDRKSNGRLNYNRNGDLGLVGLGDSPQHLADFYAGVTSNHAANRAGAAADIVDPRTTVKGFLISGSADYRPSTAFGAKLTLGYMRNDLNDEDFDVDGYVNPLISSTVRQLFRQFSAELQFSGKVIDDKLDYVAGLYYFREKGPDTTDSTALGAVGNTNTVGVGEGRNRSMSGYAHVKYKLDDTTTLQVGTRYTQDNKDLDVTQRLSINGGPYNCIYIPGTPFVTNNGTTCQYSPRSKFKFWSYTAGLDHEFMDGLFGYVKTSSTQRSGGNQIRAADGNVPPFSPEKITDYEIGLKTDFFDHRARINADYFYGNYTNIQTTSIFVTATTGTTSTIVVNVGNAVVQGFEIESSAALPGGFGLEGNISMTDVTYADPNRLQFRVPKWIVNGALTYRHDVGFGEFHGRLDIYHRSVINSAETRSNLALNPIKQLVPAYTLLGARLGVELENGLDISAYCHNCTAKKYFVDQLAVTPTIVEAYPGEPRTFGIEANYKF